MKKKKKWKSRAAMKREIGERGAIGEANKQRLNLVAKL